jgi:hypothetical protein
MKMKCIFEKVNTSENLVFLIYVEWGRTGDQLNARNEYLSHSTTTCIKEL